MAFAMPSATQYAIRGRTALDSMVVRRNPSLIAGGAIVATLALAAAGGPLLVRIDPLAIDLRQVLAAPSRGHWLGCDALGRDMLARVLWGARLSLVVSVTVVTLSLLVGSIIGGAAALAGGRVDSVVMRLVDVVLAFPGFLLAIALAAILGPGLIDLVVALAAVGWTGYARLVRGEVLSLREREYVEAARALGASPRRLLLRHLMPGLAGPLAVQATFGVGGIIIAEAALSFLGLGALPPTPSWGNMLDSGRAFLLVAPHLTTAPGVAIGASVLGFNLLGDGLAQALGRRG
jgi:peptide/nickel transport system permease protein